MVQEARRGTRLDARREGHVQCAGRAGSLTDVPRGLDIPDAMATQVAGTLTEGYRVISVYVARLRRVAWICSVVVALWCADWDPRGVAPAGAQGQVEREHVVGRGSCPWGSGLGRR